ncbi:FAM96B protein [Purpureocillium lavendulum]|uniref:FAM96B protein n=1 Tax=Purpureocillium lavendulum TaxID=1247861 RepID=A0AB34FV34_9HYPO|nr:FAM96B protein [Purpureocillium lavendulum]
MSAAVGVDGDEGIMAPAALDNANPTILSASQLPTRQKKAVPRKGPDTKYDSVLSRPTYLSRPFCDVDVPWSRGDGADDTFADEAIDEQEIYALHMPHFSGGCWAGCSSPDAARVSHTMPRVLSPEADRRTDLISDISDPEHPVSLGLLSVVNLPDIHITPSPALGVPDVNTIVNVSVELTPTVTHCSLATVLGLGVRVRLEQVLPPNYRVDVRCKENSHTQDDQVNKQLADKERVAAALENDTLKGVLDKMLETCA